MSRDKSVVTRVHLVVVLAVMLAMAAPLVTAQTPTANQGVPFEGVSATIARLDLGSFGLSSASKFSMQSLPKSFEVPSYLPVESRERWLRELLSIPQQDDSVKFEWEPSSFANDGSIEIEGLVVPWQSWPANPASFGPSFMTLEGAKIPSMSLVSTDEVMIPQGMLSLMEMSIGRERGSAMAGGSRVLLSSDMTIGNTIDSLLIPVFDIPQDISWGATFIEPEIILLDRNENDDVLPPPMVWPVYRHESGGAGGAPSTAQSDDVQARFGGGKILDWFEVKIRYTLRKIYFVICSPDGWATWADDSGLTDVQIQKSGENLCEMMRQVAMDSNRDSWQIPKLIVRKSTFPAVGEGSRCDRRSVKVNGKKVDLFSCSVDCPTIGDSYGG